MKKDGERVVAETTTTSAKALALGVTYDPSFDFPIPLGGINYLDFDFLGKDSQLAVIFGGVLALVNVQHPKLIGDRIDASLDLFAIAVARQRPHVRRRRRAARRAPRDAAVLDRAQRRLADDAVPAAVGELPVPLRPFQHATSSPRPRFVVPVSTATNGVGLIWDWKRARLLVRRRAPPAFGAMSWQPWGNPGDVRPGRTRTI